MAAANMANIPHGGDRSSVKFAGCSQEEAAGFLWSPLF
jgi:hypothetical protein